MGSTRSLESEIRTQYATNPMLRSPTVRQKRSQPAIRAPLGQVCHWASLKIRTQWGGFAALRSELNLAVADGLVKTKPIADSSAPWPRSRWASLKIRTQWDGLPRYATNPILRLPTVGKNKANGRFQRSVPECQWASLKIPTQMGRFASAARRTQSLRSPMLVKAKPNADSSALAQKPLRQV